MEALPEEEDEEEELARVPLELQDARALRKELRRLRKGREVMAMRVKKARRELARARKRQKEAEKTVLLNEGAVAVISQRLGCSPEGLPEIDEWRELAREHGLREKELRKQLADEQAEHAVRIVELRAELAKGGRPETSRAAEAADNRAKRWAADERCGRIQAVRDYLRGDLDGLGLDELRELASPKLGEGEGKDQEGEGPQEMAAALGEHEELIELVLEELRERHQQGLRDLVQLSNAVIGKKDSLLKALAYNVLGRGLEDMKLCTPAERSALRELLQDVESLCSWRLAAGSGHSE